MIEPSCTKNPIHDGGSNEWLSMHAINNQHAAGEGRTTADDGGREIRETREGEVGGYCLLFQRFGEEGVGYCTTIRRHQANENDRSV